MKTTFSLAILFCFSLASSGQQSTAQPIEIVNDTGCTLRFIAYCSSDGTCDPSDEDNIQPLAEQALAWYSIGNLSQCTGTHPYFAYLEFSFDGFTTSHLVTFDPDLGNNCAGLVDCDNYTIPYGFLLGVLDEDCTGDDGGVRVNGAGSSLWPCAMSFTD